jgi:hypothetical protein
MSYVVPSTTHSGPRLIYLVWPRAILTMFQIPPVASDPVTRTTALLSLVSALMSLCYGCVYILRFATMGSMYRAAKFAEVTVSRHYSLPQTLTVPRRRHGRRIR